MLAYPLPSAQRSPWTPGNGYNGAMSPINEKPMSNALLLIGAGALVVGVVSLVIRRANRTPRRANEPERARQSLRGVPLPVRRTSTGTGSYSRYSSSDRRSQDDSSLHTGLFASTFSHGSRDDDSPSRHSSGGYHTGGGIGGGSYDSGSSSSDSCSSSSDSGGCGGGGD